MAEEKYLRQYEKSASGNYLLKQRGLLENVIGDGGESTITLTQEQSGSIIIPTKAGAVTTTLPAVKKGLYFKFFSGSAQLHVINGGAAVIQGLIYDNTNANTLAHNDVSDATSITIANGAVGDCLEFHCDGTNWYVEGRLNDTPTVA
tara:strand:+ start:196 stop:636 length:441 start_codon:yes stop_codon:yes gene_type:complete